MKFFPAKFIFLQYVILFCHSIPTYPFDSDSSSTEHNSENILHRIILIGDAGDPAVSGEPVLIALENKASELPGQTLVIFLGDNIYSNGLPDEDDPERKEYERKIDQQISVLTNTGASGIFIPGNHDWKQGKAGGWQRILNQQNYILSYGTGKISFYPPDGCPGPVAIDVSSKISIILLDTQWWFQDEGTRPEAEDSICLFCTEDAVITALDGILNASEEKFVLIAAHHPLSTHGPHGGYFDWKDHIFPLRHLNEFLWLPLPIIGSLYPLVRGSGVSEQDLGSSKYQHLITMLKSVISKYSGIVYASGHEHALQILDGKNNNTYVVSGAGIWGHVEESLGEGDDTIFSAKHEGFFQLDYFEDGCVMLSAVKVLNEAGESAIVFSMQIDAGF